MPEVDYGAVMSKQSISYNSIIIISIFCLGATLCSELLDLNSGFVFWAIFYLVCCFASCYYVRGQGLDDDRV